MSRELVTIQVKVKGTKHEAKAPVWTSGLEGDPSADAPVVFADAIETGLVTSEKLFALINYAEDLKTRASVTQQYTPKKGKASDSVLNQITALWAKLSPETFTKAVQEERQHEALVAFYGQVKAMNADVAPDRQAIETHLPTCLDTVVQ